MLMMLGPGADKCVPTNADAHDAHDGGSGAGKCEMASGCCS